MDREHIKYKKELWLGSPLYHDELFKVTMDWEQYTYVLDSSPVRGEFKTTDNPYGCNILGYGGEVQFTIHVTGLQSGDYSIVVVMSMVDSWTRLYYGTSRSLDISEDLSDILNQLYFGAGDREIVVVDKQSDLDTKGTGNGS